MKKMLVLLAVGVLATVAAFAAKPAPPPVVEAWPPVEHCSYEVTTKKPEIHLDHAGRCDNTDNSQASFDGSCDYSSGFYWTSIICNDAIYGCEFAGQIRCPDGAGGYTLRTYNFYCPEGGNPNMNGTVPAASAGRESVTCTTEEMTGSGGWITYTQTCDCGTSQSAWDNYCN